MFNFIKRDRLVSGYLPLVGHMSEGVLLLDYGSVFAMFELAGLPWETCDPRNVSERQIRLNHTYRNIAADSVVVSVYQCRGMASSDVYPSGAFRSAFSESLDTSYRANLFDRSLFDNRLYMGIQVRPPRYAGEFIGEQVSRRQKAAEEAPEYRVRRLEDTYAMLAVELSAYRPRRLGLVERGCVIFSEIAEALVMALTGKWRPIGLSTGRLGEALLSERIIVGSEAIEYRLPGTSWFGPIFGMRHFPATTWPGMFGALLGASYQCTLYQSFRFVPTQVAQDIMKRKRSRMLAANPMARGPVMATLYHRVDKLIDGRRLLFVIDEFWKALLDPAFRELVNDKLRTLRKLNSPMILATQSPRDALVSAISHTIREQCPSQVYFANGQAAWDDFGENGMGLTEAEWNIVRALPEGRGEFLLKQGNASVRAQLPLAGMDDEIAILSGREATTRIFDRVKDLHTANGDPLDMLRAFQADRKREPAA